MTAKAETPTISQILTELALSTPENALSAGARQAARKMLLDTFACALAGWKEAGVTESLDLLRDWGGKPEARVLCHGDRLPGPQAAYVNGAMIHALDYDDIYIPGSLHATSVVVPAVLAAGELAGATCRETLAAFIVGIEVAGRLSVAFQNAIRRQHAWMLLPTTMVGGFGAVAGAARLLKLTPEACINALGLNYAQASGNRQALLDATLAKRLQPAFATRSAMWAVALAARGVTGTPLSFEGQGGLFRAYLESEPPASDFFRQPRERWAVERMSIKRHTSCGACHSSQMAAERLREEAKLTAADIARVELYGSGPGGLVGNRFEIGPNPQVSAQFSVQYAVAYALLRGAMRLAAFTDAAILADREVAELAGKITFVPPPPDNPPPLPPDFSPYNAKPHGVIVYTRDGRRLERAQRPLETFAPEAVDEAGVLTKLREATEYAGASERYASFAASAQMWSSDRPLADLLDVWAL